MTADESTTGEAGTSGVVREVVGGVISANEGESVGSVKPPTWPSPIPSVGLVATVLVDIGGGANPPVEVDGTFSGADEEAIPDSLPNA